MTTTMILDKNVVVWGDSLCKGVIWNEQRGRYGYSVTTAANVVAKKLDISIVNRAKFGYTAPQGLVAMEHDLAEGITCDTGVIEFGGNDCNFKWDEIAADPGLQHNPATTPELFESTLKRMVQRLRERKIRPILLTPPPINAERYFKFLSGDKLNTTNLLTWLGDVQQIYRFQELYSHIVQKVARELQVALLDLRARCLANSAFVSALLCQDGLHLSEKGQQFVGEQIAELVMNGEE
ncbi:MAG: GDSL-type esterase/lipase family protein [Clostridia bacterium]